MYHTYCHGSPRAFYPSLGDSQTLIGTHGNMASTLWLVFLIFSLSLIAQFRSFPLIRNGSLLDILHAWGLFCLYLSSCSSVLIQVIRICMQVMIDLDAPSTYKPSMREWILWWIFVLVFSSLFFCLHSFHVIFSALFITIQTTKLVLYDHYY